MLYVTYLHKGKIQLVDIRLFLPHQGFIGCNLHSDADDKIPDTWVKIYPDTGTAQDTCLDAGLPGDFAIGSISVSQEFEDQCTGDS